MQINEVVTTVNDGEYLKHSNYWETSWNREGVFFLFHNEGAFRLLVPDIHRNAVEEMRTGKTVLMGYGYHQQIKKRVVTLVFDDLTEYPFSMTMPDYVCLGPISEESFGHQRRTLHVYVNPDKLELTLPCFHTGTKLPCYMAA